MIVKLTVAQIVWRDFRVVSIPVNYELRCQPEPGYPHGCKAARMSDLWVMLRGMDSQGVLWLDPDVAADPDDLAAMTAAVRAHPADVHTALVKLWPQSTGLDHWIWSHRGGTLGSPAATQEETVPIAYVATGFLWTPARLLDLAFPRGRAWQWIEVDVSLSTLALQHSIPMRVVAGCRPKHLHFTREHEPWTSPTGQ